MPFFFIWFFPLYLRLSKQMNFPCKYDFPAFLILCVNKGSTNFQYKPVLLCLPLYLLRENRSNPVFGSPPGIQKKLVLILAYSIVLMLFANSFTIWEYLY